MGLFDRGALRWYDHRIEVVDGDVESSIMVAARGRIEPTRVVMRLHSTPLDGADLTATPFLPVAALLGSRLGLPVRFTDPVDRAALEGARRTLPVAREAFGWGRSSITAPIAPAVARPDRPAALFFTRGVDSYASLIRYRENFQMLIGLEWVDPPYASQGQRDIFVATEQSAAELGLPLLRVSTTLREVLDPFIQWELSHGAALCGLALIAAGLIGEAWLSNAYREDLVEPDSGIRTDLLENWSSSAVRIVRSAGAPSRNAKAALIAPDPHVQRWLQVCWESWEEGNCGTCFKCLHTMSNFATSGSLEMVQARFAAPLTAEAVRTLDASHAAPSLLLTIIELTDELPDGDVRDAWSEVLELHHPGAQARLGVPRDSDRQR
jgi:hypothetical protein